MENLKQRHGCVTAWLWIVIVINLIMFLTFCSQMLSASLSDIMWGNGVLASLALVNVLSAILLMRWNRWGLYLLALNVLAGIGCNVCILGLGLYEVLPSALGIFIYCCILQIRKDGVSAWSLMNNSFDWAHCRHLYQVFMGVIALVLVVTAFRASSVNKTLASSDDVEQTDEDYTSDEEQWNTFKSTGGECTVEAPADFHMAELNPNQILGLICTDYDPALIVICEPTAEFLKFGVKTPKEYAEVILKQNRNLDGVKDYKLINTVSKDNYHMVTYNLTGDGTKFRYMLYATKSKKYFYYCLVFCLEEYADKLESKMERMAKSFKPIK